MSSYCLCQQVVIEFYYAVAEGEAFDFVEPAHARKRSNAIWHYTRLPAAFSCMASLISLML